MSAAIQTARLYDARHGFCPEEWEARLDLAAAYRLAARFGWHDLQGNHFSLRVPGTTDQYLLNPPGRFFEEITASSLVKVDTRGNILGDACHGINRAGEVFHSAILAARPDITSVMHLYFAAGAGISMHNDGVVPISPNALLTLDRIPCHEHEGPESDYDERRRLVRDLAVGSILMLRDHVTLLAGRTIGEALMLLSPDRAGRRDPVGDAGPLRDAISLTGVDRPDSADPAEDLW